MYLCLFFPCGLPKANPKEHGTGNHKLLISSEIILGLLMKDPVCYGFSNMLAAALFPPYFVVNRKVILVYSLWIKQ